MFHNSNKYCRDDKFLFIRPAGHCTEAELSIRVVTCAKIAPWQQSRPEHGAPATGRGSVSVVPAVAQHLKSHPGDAGRA